MSNVNSDILLAKKIINSNSIKRFERIYPFTNENILECFNNFDLKNKNILSVLASSDQVFDMYLKGAKEIDTFDLNPLTKYYFYLKKAAIISGLSLEEYLDFFRYGKEIVFDKGVFDKISKYLDINNYEFWNTLFKEYSNIALKEKLFENDIDTKNTLKYCTGYLNENSYKVLQKNIENLNIKFINFNIKDLPYKLTKKYDFMYFSNIIQYADYMYEDRYLDTKKNQIYKLTQFKKLINEFEPFLNKNGKILLGYIFAPKIGFLNIAVFNKKAKKSVFYKKEYEYLKFNSTYNNKNLYDECIVYTKKR